MALNLWLGLYSAPGEWPWTYGFLIIIQALFVLDPPGRCLGLEARHRTIHGGGPDHAPEGGLERFAAAIKPDTEFHKVHTELRREKRSRIRVAAGASDFSPVTLCRNTV